MPDNKDYVNLTLEELLTEEKKVKKKETVSAIVIGFLIGIIVYGVVRNGFGIIYTVIPLILIVLVYRNSKNDKEQLKQIRTEINNKKAR